MNNVQETLKERGSRYGDFSNHARICQELKHVMMSRSGAGWARLSDVQKQALDVIADKIARILSGDPNYADNWHDIQGYAKLAEDRLLKTADKAVQDEKGEGSVPYTAWPFGGIPGMEEAMMGKKAERTERNPLDDLPSDLRPLFELVMKELGPDAKVVKVTKLRV